MLVENTNRLKGLTAFVVVAELLDASLLFDSSVAQGHHVPLQATQPNCVALALQAATPFGNWTHSDAINHESKGRTTSKNNTRVT
jgi:hypothetical protein